MRGGLLQQGWRDAFDPTAVHGPGIVDADGQGPAPGKADADTQAVVRPRCARSTRLSRRLGWDERRRALRIRISGAFGPDVMALDLDDRHDCGCRIAARLAALGRRARARRARGGGQRLCQPDILTRYGLRTIYERSPPFDPHAYHRGSVWPFDSWLGWGGLRAAGRAAEAERVRTGVLAAVGASVGAGSCTRSRPSATLEVVARGNRRQAWTAGAGKALAHRMGRPMVGVGSNWASAVHRHPNANE